MYLRKYLLNHFEEFSNIFKIKFGEQGILTVGRCSIAATLNIPDLSRRCHWSTEPSCKIPVLTDAKDLPRPTSDNLYDSDELGIMSSANAEDMDLCRSSSDEEVTPCQPCLTEQRSTKVTPYGRALSLSKCIRPRNNDIFSVATYNVLSQHLLEMHRYLYKNCRSNNLTWSARSERLLKDFQHLNADVFCLQEVEEDHLKSFFEKELGRMGYAGIYKKRTHDKVDGCAIFYKTDKFDLIKLKTVELYKDSVKLLDRDNIGVIAELALKARPAQHIVVATTHLLYTPRRTDIRLTQTQVMLAEMERIAFKGDKSYWPIIFTGDMNYTPYSVVYNLVEKGYMKYESAEIFSNSYRGSKKFLLPQRLGVTDSCQFESALKKRSRENDEVYYGSGTLDHHLQLGSVYSHVKDNSMEASTFQDEWHTVDYIFYSQRLQNNKRVEGDLRLISYLELPNANEAAAKLGRIPNDICGSDHLPLLATFHLRSEDS